MLPCNLYLTTTSAFVIERDEENLLKIVKKWRPSALRLTTTNVSEARTIVGRIARRVQDAGTAMVLTNLPDLARELRCDAVHLTSLPANSNEIRSLVGGDLQVGIFCHASRDEVMHAGELGADYVSVAGDAFELAQWWSQMMELPIVAEAITDSFQAQTMMRAGVDFMAVPLDFRDLQVAESTLKRIFVSPETERRS